MKYCVFVWPNKVNQAHGKIRMRPNPVLNAKDLRKGHLPCECESHNLRVGRRCKSEGNRPSFDSHQGKNHLTGRQNLKPPSQHSYNKPQPCKSMAAQLLHSRLHLGCMCHLELQIHALRLLVTNQEPHHIKENEPNKTTKTTRQKRAYLGGVAAVREGGERIGTGLVVERDGVYNVRDRESARVRGRGKGVVVFILAEEVLMVTFGISERKNDSRLKRQMPQALPLRARY
ncbi:hypothetical protein SADUNF_Sadunf04G0145200 [Salix dunnii]|uniref:Uncharacterized protein n=1 Tax=Salix dunnii TaxID=1413687 RepID=A0A835N162_9ROSI|nr:hypothetical protein SADUNF_Sadunf04G0145200 [Salix dunnii]